MNSALYVGRVMHQRLRPMRHRLGYRVFSMLFDLDELPQLGRELRFFSVGRFNLFSFRPSDHAEGGAQDVLALRRQVESRLREAGMPTGGALRLLAMPRVLGHAFNPLSVWFCHAPSDGDAPGRLQAILYEVNNTFGQRHSYLVEAGPACKGGSHGILDQRCEKNFYVSPFMDMEMHYRFRIQPPAESLSVGVSVHEGEGEGSVVLNARFDAERVSLGDASLLRVFLSHPLLGLKVVGGIHWEALRLWLKGARLRPRPDAPMRPVTIVRSTVSEPHA